MYGLVEKQFKTYFKIADRQKGVTGTNFLVLLERRLDNTVYRLGFANSRDQARQLVRHSHFLVNGKLVNIPSYLLRPGDTVLVLEASRQLPAIQEALEAMPRRGLPPWLDVQEHLIVEFYSK
jgi:small subunit ribosomal protein S4